MVRFKNRWLLVEFIAVVDSSTTATAPALDGQKIFAALRQSVLTNFGDVGWGSVGLSLSVKYYSPMTNICIIRVGREPHKIAWAAVTLLTAIEGRRYIPNVLHLSGTIKHTQLAAITHNREIVARFRAQAKTASAYQDSYDAKLETINAEIQALQD
ncbi:Ribonuclease P/MRP protein subunit POP5 [Mycena indigotica]|uniref:Ribonuclease P/MRP protein subunit POP5 n=1 Tax=Mycena indigotica TaxID=2126181 RepID=A0A8H6SJE7_9AGAR|nr:Ribonuclease P/MRP protein subunit POP5 [Mycena indigotica]KAF7298945.1 Ribonuclease P/MRP protein subunit POP5 [Mycena indigotica]